MRRFLLNVRYFGVLGALGRALRLAVCRVVGHRRPLTQKLSCRVCERCSLCVVDHKTQARKAHTAMEPLQDGGRIELELPT